MRFSVGSVVEVWGLSHQSHLNGTVRSIAEREEYHDEIYGIVELYKLDKLPNKRFRSENLKPIDHIIDWTEMKHLWVPSQTIQKQLNQGE